MAIVGALRTTPTARWHRAAQDARWRNAAWDDRLRCFDVLQQLIDDERPPRQRGERRVQAPIRPPSLDTIARHTAWGRATLYKWWSAVQGAETMARWAGADPGITPGQAFIAEAKIASFLPFRSGVLCVASAFDMTPTEIASAYFRSLASWAGSNPALAACLPGGPPRCMAEDFSVIAAWPAGSGYGHNAEIAEIRAERLCRLAEHVLAQVLADESLTPQGAYDCIRADVAALLDAQPAKSLAAQALDVLTELSDQLLHDMERTVTRAKRRDLLAALDGLRALLAEPSPPNPGISPADVAVKP